MCCRAASRRRARAAVRDLELDDYERLFAGRAIKAGVRDDAPASSAPLYARVLATAWDELPGEIRAMHDGIPSAEGRAKVERGNTMLSRLVAWIIGFPEASSDAPVRVRFRARGDTETWTRSFGNHSFSSRQFRGHGRSDGLLCERFGPLTFAMALVRDEARLSLECVRNTASHVAVSSFDLS